MKLNEWLDQNEVSDQEAAEGIGMSLSGFRKIKYGERVGSPRTIRNIVKYTGGEVSHADVLAA